MSGTGYSVAEAAQLLGVSNRTLTTWIHEDDVQVARNETDRRRTALTPEQLEHLAEQHGRQFNVLAQAGGDSHDLVAYIRATLKDLARRVKSLEAEDRKLDERVSSALRITTLLQAEGCRQHDDIQLMLKEREQLILAMLELATRVKNIERAIGAAAQPPNAEEVIPDKSREATRSILEHARQLTGVELAAG